jgi:ribosomal protein S18 acetylase RimI-like enzyme
MTEIREIKPNEYDFLREMLYEAIYFPVGTEKLPASIVNEPWLSKYVENFGQKGDFAFVLVEKNELVGAVWSRLFTEDKAGYGFIDEKTPEFSIAINERFRNQGFGVLMIEKLFEKLKSEGFEKLSLSVDKRSPAQNLYRRLGFEIIREEGTAFTMLKKL